jgi:hypothetical protein
LSGSANFSNKIRKSRPLICRDGFFVRVGKNGNLLNDQRLLPQISCRTTNDLRECLRKTAIQSSKIEAAS